MLVKKVGSLVLAMVMAAMICVPAMAVEEKASVRSVEEVLADIDFTEQLQAAKLGLIDSDVEESVLNQIEVKGIEDNPVSYTVQNLGLVEEDGQIQGTMYSVMATQKTTSDDKTEDNVYCYLAVTWVDNLGGGNELKTVSGEWDTERTLSDRKVVYGVDDSKVTKRPTTNNFRYANIGMTGLSISATMSVNSKGYDLNPITLTVTPSIFS